MPITFLAGCSHEGARCATIGQVSKPIFDIVHNIGSYLVFFLNTKLKAWAARNFSVYLKATNGIAIILLGFIFIGLIMVYSKTSVVFMQDGYLIFSLIIGASMVFLNKGLNI